MDFVGERYYKLNRILLLCLGLWPYQTSTLKKTQIIFFQTLFISFLICQCNTLLIKKYSIDYINKLLLFIMINCIYIIEYNACLLLADDIKCIFDRVQYDWNMLKAHTELEVIRKYADDAKLYTICFTFFVISGAMGFMILICLPHILDVIVPMNESRPRQTLIIVEYFVNEETYFFAFLIHIIVVQYAGGITIASFATIIIACVMHTCAMFKIASHRIEHIFDENTQQMPIYIKEYIFYNKLIHAVYIHRRAMDSANIIMTNSFAKLCLLLLGFGVASISLSFFNFCNAVTSLNEVELLLFGAIIFIQLYYCFLGNYSGQNIIDSSINICQATYNAQWYDAPLYMQKLILFIIQRSNKRTTLTAGIFVASLEGFATLMSMSISYFMVLQSMEVHKENHEKNNNHV